MYDSSVDLLSNLPNKKIYPLRVDRPYTLKTQLQDVFDDDKHYK